MENNINVFHQYFYGKSPYRSDAAYVVKTAFSSAVNLTIFKCDLYTGRICLK